MKTKMSCRQSLKLLKLCNSFPKFGFIQRNASILAFPMLRNVSQQSVYRTSISAIPVRFKYSAKDKDSSRKDEDSDSDSDEFEDVKEKGTNLIKCSVTSLRADLIIKTGLGLARNKVEVKFYEGKVRVNGKKIPKKSFHVNIGDEIDLVKSVSPTNPDHLIIGRVEIVSATPKEDSISVLLRRYKTLIIENYEERNAYKESEG